MEQEDIAEEASAEAPLEISCSGGVTLPWGGVSA